MKEFGAHFLRRGDLAYAFIRGRDFTTTELYEPTVEEIDEELKKHFHDAPRWYLMEMIRNREPDIRGFVIEVEKFTEAWQNGEIDG